jgi:hypothetical protein
MWYSYENEPDKFIGLSAAKVREIIEMNKAGKKPERLADESVVKPVVKEPDYENVVGQDSLTRFDRKKQPQKNKRRGNQRGRNRNKPNNPNQKKS